MSHLAEDHGEGPVAVRVRVGSRTVSGGQIALGDWLRGSSNQIWFGIPGVGAFACIAGEEIWIDPASGASAQMLELFAAGTALGIIHYQRGEFPLHGAFVEYDGRAVGLCAASGCGKSTLAYALAIAGCAVLSDDVAVVREVDGQPRVYGDATHARLDTLAASHFGLSTDGIEPVGGEKDKFFVAMAAAPAARPPRLHALIALEPCRSSDPLEVEPLPAVEALAALRRHTYRSFMIAALALEEPHFDFCTGLLATVPMYRLRRPRGFEFLAPQADLMLEQVLAR